MRLCKHSHFLFSFCLLALPPGVFAFSDVVSNGYANTAAAYLSLPDNAQSIALGGTMTAWKNLSTWSHFNPALLDAVTPLTLKATYAIMTDDRRNVAATIAAPAGPYCIAGLSLISYGVNDIQGRDEFGDTTGNFNDNETAVALTVAGKLPYHISCGIAARYINQMLANGRANGFGLDVGATCDPLPYLSIGASALNLGSHLVWNTGANDLVRPTGRLGIAGKILDSTLTIEGDCIKTDYQPVEASLGAEYVFLKMFALRVGTASSFLIAGQQASSPDFSFGLGLFYHSITADYGCKIPADGLELSHWISVSIDIPRTLGQW